MLFLQFFVRSILILQNLPFCQNVSYRGYVVANNVVPYDIPLVFHTVSYYGYLVANHVVPYCSPLVFHTIFPWCFIRFHTMVM